MLQSYNIRNSDKFLRNNCEMSGLWEIPLIQRQEIDLNNIKLLSCSHTRLNEDEQHRQYGVHFYVDDPEFNGIYNYPERTLQKYAQYRFLLTPDFSLYAEMPMWLQIVNVTKNRWCGAYWQNKGLTVIPTISWSTSQSYGFCFVGVELTSITPTARASTGKLSGVPFIAYKLLALEYGAIYPTYVGFKAPCRWIYRR